VNGEEERRDRREFLRAVGRYGFLGSLLLLGGVLAARRRGAPRGADCPPGKPCAECPEPGGCEGVPGRTTLAGLAGGTRWQIDPERCVQCGQCATRCVLAPSAVKCVHNFTVCGYCKLCFGFFLPGATLDEGAENQRCPTGAIRRAFVEHPYFEYTIDETLCVGCGRCVKGCTTFGNGSLQLQVRHDRCVNCNECSIARDCPAGAYRRVPAASPYLLKVKA
jgi:electron transport complex protein RnfB